MLIGQYKHTVDSKKRLALPAKFRGELGSTVVITKGIERCLVIYTESEWRVQAEKISNLPSSQVEARAFARSMLSGAMEVSLDKLGRVLIPDYLKDYAGLGKEVTICGLSNRLEIWDSEKWEEYMKDAEDDIQGIASKLGPLGI